MEGDGISCLDMPFILIFQSTPSAWRETFHQCACGIVREISIHSLRMEGDNYNHLFLPLIYYFNPLPPHGGRHFISRNNSCNSCISIHSLRMEGDQTSSSGHCPNCRFQSTPSAWRETSTTIPRLRHRRDFNPLPPHGGRLNYNSKITT